MPPYIEQRGPASVTVHTEVWEVYPSAHSLGEIHNVNFDGFRTNGGADASFPSIKFLCPICGSVWGEIEVILHESWRTPSQWIAHREPCPAHGAARMFTDFSLQQYEAGHNNIPHPLALKELSRQLLNEELK